jgi:hypothetical protein
MTHPPSGPSTPTPPPGPKRPPSVLPRIGEVVRDVERYVAQALAVLERQVDETSLPQDADERTQLDTIRTSVGFHLDAVGRELAKVAALNLPPAGSAVAYPAVDPGQKTRCIRVGPMPETGPRHRHEMPGTSRIAALINQLTPGSYRHEPDRPGASGLPPRPIDCPRPRLLG